MDKRTLSERDICTKFSAPALRKAGWGEMLQIREEGWIHQGPHHRARQADQRTQAKRADTEMCANYSQSL
jgi:type I restriction enzyme, R subunit